MAEQSNKDNKWDNLIKALQTTSETVSEITKKIDTTGIADALMIGARAIKEVARPLYQNQEYFKSLAKELSEIYSNIHIPDLDTDSILTGFRKWGQYGWAVKTRGFNFQFYKNCPDSKADADQLMDDYFTDSVIDDMFELTREQAALRCKSEITAIDDYEEAVKLYGESHLKPCSLMMFSIIDGFFIRNEGEKRADEKNLSVGLKAGIRVLESIRNSYNQQKSFVELCFLENLIECQKTLFAFGDDFKVQPQVINRNFIDHGMYDAKVNKIDCLKLFLYYYNVLQIFNEKKK